MNEAERLALVKEVAEKQSLLDQANNKRKGELEVKRYQLRRDLMQIERELSHLPGVRICTNSSGGYGCILIEGHTGDCDI